MRLLMIWPEADTPDRYNYLVNYGLWDALRVMPGVTHEVVPMMTPAPQFVAALAGDYDLVFAPMWRRLAHRDRLVGKVHKLTRAPVVMFDNDGCCVPEGAHYYKYMDYVFVRGPQYKGGSLPPEKSMWLPWCVDLRRFTPVFGGEGVVLIGGRTKRVHPLRRKIFKRYKQRIRVERVFGDEYIGVLQEALAGITTGGRQSKVARAKVLEMAACGCAVVTDRSDYLDRYFPEDLLYVIEDVADMGPVLDDLEGDRAKALARQQSLYQITAERHGADRQARSVMRALEYIAARQPVPAEVKYAIEHPLEGPI